MTSGMRHLIREAMLWLFVFTCALLAFMYLDGRISRFLEVRNNQQEIAASSPNEQPQAASPDNTEQNAAANAADDDEGGFGRVVLRAGPTGHFEVNAYINNRQVDLMADTGATHVVLTWEDARHLGITDDLQFTGRANTANGVSKIAPVILESVEVGDIKLYDVQAVVAEDGALGKSLLGMSFIGRLQRFEMSGRRLILVR